GRLQRTGPVHADPIGVLRHPVAKQTVQLRRGFAIVVDEGMLSELDEELMPVDLPHELDVAVANVACRGNAGVELGGPPAPGRRIHVPVDALAVIERLAEELDDVAPGS